jgi:hypothetical protein
MAQPFNYSLGVPSPMEAGQKAYQTELQSLNVQAQMQAAQAQAIAAQQKAQQEALRQQQWQQVTARLASPDANANDYQMAMLLGNKEQAEAISAIFKQRAEEQNRAAISKIGPVVYALHAGKPDAAIATLEQQKQAHSDNPAAVQEIDGQIALIKANPDAAQLQLGGTLSLVPGGDKVLDNLLKLTKERRDAQMGAVELRQKGAQATTAEIEARYAERVARLTLDEKQQNIAAARQRLNEARTEGVAVQSSQIMPDGSVVLVTKTGQSKVIDPEGNELTGPARREAIVAAASFGVDEQGKRSGARRGAEIGQKKAEEAFEALGKTRTNIANIDQAIEALDKGANTGAIASRLPSVKAASVELQNVRNKLGLDVVGSVTFGALSEGELNLALDTALPTGLNEKELRKWLVNKKTAQSKLAGYLSDQARFLSRPGRTVGDWLDKQEAESKKPPPEKKPFAFLRGGQDQRNVRVDF